MEKENQQEYERQGAVPWNRFRIRFPCRARVWRLLGIAFCFLSVPVLSQEKIPDDRPASGETALLPSPTGFPSMKVSCPPLPSHLDFCGEDVPLGYFLCRERLERELMSNTYLHGTTMLILKRSHRYFPVIEPILKEEGIPDDFKYLCVIESSLTDAVSPAQAAGFWQFLEGTARDYGLEVNAYIDERYNLKKATRAACRFIAFLKENLGSWTLAAAAYNTGMKNMEYHIRNQDTASYYCLHLPEETSRYVYRILSMKLIMQTPGRYGFLYDSSQGFIELPEKEIAIDRSIGNLFEFAREQGISYQMLKLYNPWLRKNELPNKSGRTYRISLPESLPADAPAAIRTIPPQLPEPIEGPLLKRKTDIPSQNAFRQKKP